MDSRLEGCILAAVERLNGFLFKGSKAIYAWHEVESETSARIVAVRRGQGDSADHLELEVVLGEGVHCEFGEGMIDLIFQKLSLLVEGFEGPDPIVASDRLVLTPPERNGADPPKGVAKPEVSLLVGNGNANYQRNGPYPQNEGSVPEACAEFNQRFRAADLPWVAWQRLGEENGVDIEVVTKAKGLGGPTLGVQHTCALLEDAGQDAANGHLNRKLSASTILEAIKRAIIKKSGSASQDRVLAIDMVDLQVATEFLGLEDTTGEIQELARKSNWGAIVLCGGGFPGYSERWVLHPIPAGDCAPIACSGFPLFEELVEAKTNT